MLMKIKAYLVAGGAFLVTFLGMIFYRKKYKAEKEENAQLEANAKKQALFTEALTEGVKRYNEKINEPADRGRFIK